MYYDPILKIRLYPRNRIDIKYNLPVRTEKAIRIQLLEQALQGQVDNMLLPCASYGESYFLFRIKIGNVFYR